jgi:RNA 3'-terminal phosphate cyclase (ATP)
MKEIILDGSYGEGGGQILRSALALSMLTGRPFRIQNIRANREKPGLMKQHLCAVEAAREICSAAVQGAALHSREIAFAPGPIKTGKFKFVIGTAGSACLVFQTVLPALMTRSEKTQLVIEGGTHNVHAPFFEFLEAAFLPVLHHIGFDAELHLDRHGFYPQGGGRISAFIRPAKILKPVSFNKKPSRPFLEATAYVSRLPVSIAARELFVLEERFRLAQANLRTVEIQEALSAANGVMMEVRQDGFSEVMMEHGRIGIRAEQVAENLAREVDAYLESPAPVGKYLADQILLPMALGAGGHFLAAELTEHFKTNVFVLETFLGPCISYEPAGEAWKVTVKSVRP